MPVFLGGCRDRRPFGGRRCGYGGSVNTPFDAIDELELPGATLDLPGAQREKNTEEGNSRRSRRDLARARSHGMSCMSCMDAGIMLSFKWYITHSEPLNAITTSITVNSSASRLQPPSERVFMWRK